jgi:site-specific DNA recombinase
VPIPNVAEPIVSAEEQVAVVARLETNKTFSTRNNKNPELTLLRAGFITCGHCGWGLAVALPPQYRPGSSAQYRCIRVEQQRQGCPRPTIAASVIDNEVWERVSQVLRDPMIIAREVDRHRAEGGLDRDLAALEKQLASIADKQRKTVKAIAAVDDDDTAAPLFAELKSLAARKKAAESERDALQTRVADTAADAARLSSLSEWCSRVHANLDTLSYDEKRMAMEALGVNVRVYRPGTTDAEGRPYARWVLTVAPVSTGESIVYPSSRR